MGIAEKYRGPSGKILPGPRLTTEEVVSTLKEAFAGKHVCLAYLFGSYAEGKTTSMSDVDIAILLEGKGQELYQAYRETMLAILDALDSERFDLLLLNDAPLNLQFQVISESRPIYARNEDLLNDFEMTVIRKFQAAAQLRKVQEEYVKERAKEWYSRKTV